MKRTLVLFSLLLIAACSESEDVPVPVEVISADVEAEASITISEPECVDDSTVISYLCGPINGEDILQLGDSDWLLVSGMNGELLGNNENGKLHLVNHVDKTYELIFPTANAVIEQDMSQFAACPGPIDMTNISIHGLSLKAIDTGPEQYHLYITSHGTREAIEVFEVNAFLKPEVKWVGCIMLPVTSWTNSVTVLEDGGFYATQFMSAGDEGIGNIGAGEISGHVFEWHPGGNVEVVSGTEMSGANGIVVSEDERWLFVAGFGTHDVVRFDTQASLITRETIPLNIAPDNLRWSSDGTIYTAGNFVAGECSPSPECEGGWGVYEIDPDTMQATLLSSVGGAEIMSDASSALLVGDEIWVGTYSGNRLGILVKP